MNYKKLFFTISGFTWLAGAAACGNPPESDAVPTETGTVTGQQENMKEDLDVSENEKITPVENAPTTGVSGDKAVPTQEVTAGDTIVTSAGSGSFTDATSGSGPAKKSSPTPSPVSPLDPDCSYLKLTPENGVTVYVGKGDDSQVVVCANGNYYTFDWEYNLDYGDPIVYTGYWNNEQCHYKIPYNEKVLAVWLPTAEHTELLARDRSREICGEGHLIPLDTILADDVQDIVQDVLVDAAGYTETYDKLISGYVQDAKGSRVFSLFSSDGNPLMKYPGLSLPESGEYPVVYETTLHISETGGISQRVGISAGENTIWLGQYWNDELSLGLGYDARCSAYLKAWWPREFGMEALLDLDGDGKAEQISWRTQSNHSLTDCIVSVDGTEYTLVSNRDGGSSVLTASLDGKTNQIFVVDYGDGRTEDFIVYSYLDGELREAGRIQGLEYRQEEMDGKQAYRSITRCYPLQNDFTYIWQEFTDGILKEVPQDFYEFLRFYKDSPETPQGRNAIQVKREIHLYREKDGKETFLLPEGSRVITVGTDFKNWILMENSDTGEQGWLHVPMEEQSGTTCILPDGQELHSSEIFDGLLEYD